MQKVKYCFFLVLSLGMIACQQHREEVNFETIRPDSFSTFGTADNDVLAMPVRIEFMDDSRLAVLDPGMEQVLVFNRNGEREFSFGGYGEGPGEWGNGSAANMHFGAAAKRFIVSDPARQMLHLYNSEGETTQSLELEEYMIREDKALLSGDTLLVGTNGHEETLVQMLDLSNGLEPIGTIGEPAAEPESEMGMSATRKIGGLLAEGELPEAIVNEALVAGSKNHVAIVLTALGEIRLYNKRGDELWREELPETVTEPLWDRAIEKNKEVENDAAVYTPLELAADVVIADDRIFVLSTGTKDPEDGIDQFLLVYSLDGERLESYRFEQGENPLGLTDMVVSANNEIFMTDAANARIIMLYLNGL